MRRITSRTFLTGLFAAAALVAATGLSPAEAKGGPPKSVPHGKDTTAPVITCPSGITTNSMAYFGASVRFTVSATDDKDPAPKVMVTPGSGSTFPAGTATVTFPVGTTTVTVTATDWKLNTSTKTFDVTVLPQSGPRTYKAYWGDSEGYTVFEWDITIAADGTVTGTGRQTNALDVYLPWTYAVPLPPGLEGTGVVSGTVGADGMIEIESSSTFWYSDGEFDADWNPVYVESAQSFSGSVQAKIVSYGTLEFSVSPLASPAFVQNYPYWYLR